MKTFTIGVEIGATKQQMALAGNDGELLLVLSEKIPLPNGAQDVLNWIEANMPKIRTFADRENGQLQGIGVGFGGILESKTGRLITSVQVKGWADINLKDWFEHRFSLPTVVRNDTVCGGYGELITGSGKKSKNFFYSNIGSGIGGAWFIDRVNYDGLGKGAAYLGHTYIPDWTGKNPADPAKVEDLCSGFAIERRLRTAGYVHPKSYLLARCRGNVSLLTCKMLYEAALEADAFALEEIRRVAYSYSIGLSNLITLMNPDTISLGGGVSNFGELLLAPIRDYTNKLVFVSARDSFEIVQCTHMDNAVLVGASLYAQDLGRSMDK